MARLPIDIMTMNDRQDLPSGRSVVEGITPDAFGAGVGRATAQGGAAVGQALSGLGDVAGQFGVRLMAFDRQMKEFDYEKQFVQLQEQDNLNYAERQRGLTGGAEGHWTTARRETSDRMQSWLASLPERARAEFGPRAERFVSQRTLGAFQDQYRQADANTRQVLTEEQRKAGLQVQANPQTYEQFLAEQTELIRKSTLTPLEKEAQIAALRNGLAATAGASEAQRNPAAALAGTVGQGYRAVIRRKESADNDAAANNPDNPGQSTGSRSSALGRYQFLRGTWNEFAALIGAPLVTNENVGGANDPRRNGELQERVLDQFIARSVATLNQSQLPVTDANLYVLHFFGHGAGPRFLRALAQNPDAPAAQAFPTEASQNSSVFSGRTVGQVHAFLTRGFRGDGVSVPTGAPAGQPWREHVTPAQNTAITEAASRTMMAQLEASQAQAAAAQAQARNQLFIDLKEGPSPQTVYQEARRDGRLTDFNDITRAEGIMRERQQRDGEAQLGAMLLQNGRGFSNPYDSTHTSAVNTMFERGVKAGMSPEALGATFVANTGIMPQGYANQIRGELLRIDEPERYVRAVTAASTLQRDNPNVFTGVTGGSDLDNAATRWRTLTEDVGLSDQQAVAQLAREARDPERNSPVRSEIRQNFQRQHLTAERITSRLQSNFGAWFSAAPSLPPGAHGDAIVSTYNRFATEGFEQFRDPTTALRFADEQMKKQFGVQNGVLMRFPPERTSLPELEGHGRTWINQQAAQVVRSHLGLEVDPKDIMLIPVERGGVSTAAAFRSGRGVPASRDDGPPGSQTGYHSVPYQIAVIPRKPEQQMQFVDGVFFPDAERFAAEQTARNVANAGVSVGAPRVVRTPEQILQQDRNEAADRARVQNREMEQSDRQRLDFLLEQQRSSPDTPATSRVREIRQREIERLQSRFGQ